MQAAVPPGTGSKHQSDITSFFQFFKLVDSFWIFLINLVRVGVRVYEMGMAH